MYDCISAPFSEFLLRAPESSSCFLLLAVHYYWKLFFTCHGKLFIVRKRDCIVDCLQYQEMSYFMFVLLMTLVLPVILMLGSYLTIILLIYRRSKTHRTLATQRLETEVTLKTKSVIARAKIRTIKVTGVLVLGFILCWSPYYSMTLWWWLDRTSAQKTDYRLQKLLWAFACANNCLNPLLYRYSDNSE